MSENLQAKETRASGLKQSSYSDTDVLEAFASLNDRERMIGALLNRTNSQRGLPPFDGLDLLVKISDSGPILSDVPTWAMAECFTQAVKAHGRNDGPFQFSEVYLIWRDMSDGAKEALYLRFGPPSLARPDCDLCQNTGRQPVEVHGQGPTSKKCECGR
jgi:hypothetical protein